MWAPARPVPVVISFPPSHCPALGFLIAANTTYARQPADKLSASATFGSVIPPGPLACSRASLRARLCRRKTQAELTSPDQARCPLLSLVEGCQCCTRRRREARRSTAPADAPSRFRPLATKAASQ